MFSNGNCYSNGNSLTGDGTEQESLLWHMLLRTVPDPD